MATFKRTAITEKGKELISRAMSNETKINFTKVETTAFIYSEAMDITKVLVLDNPVQRVGISEITRKNEKVVLKIALTNENVTNTYKINAIGVYAKDDSNNEILFALLIANDPDTIEKKKGQTATTITIDLIFALSDSMQINLNMDNSATVTARMFNDLKTNIENNYIQKIDYATEQKNGIAKIYSESEANTDIPKIEDLVKTNANETAWDRLIEGLNHTKIVTIKNIARLFRKVLKPATETDQGLITEKKVKDLASSVIPEASETKAGIITEKRIKEISPKPDLSPYIPFSKGYRDKENTSEFIRTNGATTWGSHVYEMYDESGSFMGAFHINGSGAFYKAPNRAGDSWCRIMDSYDMDIRDNILNDTVRELRLAGLRSERMDGISGSIQEINGHVVTGFSYNGTIVHRRILQQRRGDFGRSWLNVPHV